jgi:FAD/FMN-containing dehydrogenase
MSRLASQGSTRRFAGRCEKLPSVGAAEGIDRRTFLAGAGVATVALAAEAGCGGDAVKIATAAAATVRRGRAGRVTRVPRTLQQAMRGHVFRRGSPGFSAVSKVYNERFDGGIPQMVARPINTADVAAAVNWCVAKGVPMRARSGGHSYAGYSTLSGGVVLDLSRMSSISVDHRTGTATVGGGAQLIDVYAGLAAHGATIPAGSCPSVGVSGVTLGGGMGLAARAFGLTLDNVAGLKVVTADGRIRTVTKHSNPDLFWALRGGGGGNFGVVTQFTFKLHALPSSAAYFNVTWPWSSASEAIAAWQAWAPHATDKVTSVFHIDAGAGNSVNANGQFLGPASALPGVLGPLLSVPGARLSSAFNSGYLALQKLLAGCATISFTACHTVGTRPGGTLPRANFAAKSDYVSRPLPAAALSVLINAAERRNDLPGSGAILFDSYGGAINRVSPTATAFVHRNELFCIQYLSYDAGGAWLSQTHAAMRPYVSGQAYQNYIDAGLSGWQQAYYGRNYARLQSIRRSIDPHHFFNFPQAIGR